MSKLNDRVSYLRGLAEGMKLNTDKDANKLLLEMLDTLVEAAKQLDVVSDSLSDLESYVESIDDDLSDLEENLYGSEDDGDEEDDDEEDDEIIQYACPHCNNTLQFHASDVDFNEDYRCPKCGGLVFPSPEEMDEEDEEIPDVDEDPDED